MEEAGRRHGGAGDPLHEFKCVRSLQLIPVQGGVSGAHDRVAVALEGDVVVAGLAVELHPIDHHLVADEVELFVGEIEQDCIADQIPLVIDRDELLRVVNLESRKAVDAEIAQQVQGIAAADEQVGHVVGLVKKRHCLLPGLLLRPPVAELRRHGEDRGSRLGVAQKLHGASRSGDRGGQRLGHVNSFVLGARRGACRPEETLSQAGLNQIAFSNERC